jgi:methionine aminopeptidase
VGYECMWVGIDNVKPSVSLGTIGHAVESYVKDQGLSMVRFPGLTGHAIGRVHCEGLFLPFHDCRPNTGMSFKKVWSSGKAVLIDRSGQKTVL